VTAPDLWDIGFGAVVFSGALLALLVWFPADIPTGFFHTNAIGREEPGDAFFPIILAIGLLILSAIQLSFALARLRSGNAAPATGEITTANFRFLGAFILIMGCGLAVMYWLGPITVAALNHIGWLNATYREVSDDAPYKYIGYVVGGFTTTIALIAWTEGRIRIAHIAAVLITLLVAILIIDVLLKNVLLPPNADF
jgi:hypothetical protein